MGINGGANNYYLDQVKTLTYQSKLYICKFNLAKDEFKQEINRAN